MIQPERIIVGIDFKKLTNSVISHALWLSNVLRCKNLTFFHIIEYNLTPPAYLLPYISKEKQILENKLNSIATDLKNQNFKIETKVLFGRLMEGLTEIAKDNAVMVIGFKRYVTRPSTSERILKGVKIPIFIVQSDEYDQISTERIKISKILCPIDFSSYSLRALEIAKDISKITNAKLLILHVVPEQRVRNIIEETELINKYLEDLREESKQKMEKIAENFDFEIISGIPSEEILKRSKEVDLIILGSKGRSYTEAIFMGSVAEAVIKNSNKNIFLIP